MLFKREPQEGHDHKWYGVVRASENYPDFRDWCDEVYDKARSIVDSDFEAQFGPQMPQRISELYYVDAFLKAGWEPVERVLGFDFAFALPSGGRLLVEVTTPAPQDSTNWTGSSNGDFSSFSYDDAGIDAALLRLTGGFWEKSKIVQKKIEEGLVDSNDYVVVALSGLRISQETPVSIELDGAVPDFVRAFLPIGPLTATVKIGEGTTLNDCMWGHSYSGQIDKAGIGKVERTAFLGDKFLHVHAVAFTPLNVLTFRNTTECIGVLHNPKAPYSADRPVIGIGPEYAVEIGDDQFHLRRM